MAGEHHHHSSGIINGLGNTPLKYFCYCRSSYIGDSSTVKDQSVPTHLDIHRSATDLSFHLTPSITPILSWLARHRPLSPPFRRQSLTLSSSHPFLLTPFIDCIGVYTSKTRELTRQRRRQETYVEHPPYSAPFRGCRHRLGACIMVSTEPGPFMSYLWYLCVPLLMLERRLSLPAQCCITSWKLCSILPGGNLQLGIYYHLNLLLPSQLKA